MLAGVLLSLALPGLAAAQEPSPEAVLADLPFLEDPNRGAIFLDLAPEGSARGLRLQLDTGAQSTVITPGHARELGVSVRRLKTTPYRRATVLDRDLLFHVRSRTSDQAARTSPFEYGLLGGNFLSEYVLEIDYPGRRVRFLDPKRYAVPEQAGEPGAEVLPLRVIANRPVVEIAVDGRRISALLDTGSPLGVILGGRSVDEVGVTPRALLGLRLFGVMGEVKTGFAEAERMRLGGFTFSRWPMILAPRGLHQQGTSSDSAIGHDLLAGFRLRIDYGRRRLWLSRVAGDEPLLLGLPWGPARSCGALFEPSGERLLVRFVLEGSPAAAVGLQPNDWIDGVGPVAPSGASFRPDPAFVADAIRTGRRLQVMRAGSDGRWHREVIGGPLP